MLLQPWHPHQRGRAGALAPDERVTRGGGTDPREVPAPLHSIDHNSAICIAEAKNRRPLGRPCFPALPLRFTFPCYGAPLAFTGPSPGRGRYPLGSRSTPVTASARDSPAVRAAQRILRLKRPTEIDTDFARRVGLSPQKIANYRAGSGASVDALAAVVARTDVNPRWLLLGEGPERIPPSDRPEGLYQRGAEEVLKEIRQCLDHLGTQFSGERSAPPAE